MLVFTNSISTAMNKFNTAQVPIIILCPLPFIVVFMLAKKMQEFSKKKRSNHNVNAGELEILILPSPPPKSESHLGSELVSTVSVLL
jgi:hypothetical protein